MSSPRPSADSLSDFDRNLLRQSVRDLLADRWPVERAVELATEPPAVAAVWRAMAAQGIASLASNADETGLREVVLAFEELGRASCPAPLLGAVAANIAFGTGQTNATRALLDDLHQGKAAIALALGAFDGDRGGRP